MNQIPELLTDFASYFENPHCTTIAEIAAYNDIHPSLALPERKPRHF